MTQSNFGLALISRIMDWPEEQAVEEFKWLRLISRTKYDHYVGFQAGSGFIEHLAIWLNQFEVEDRNVAYEFVKHRLVYISTAELSRLIESFMQEVVIPEIQFTVAERNGILPFEIQDNSETKREFERELRRCLFVGLSDGSRIDILRRYNAKVFSTEQFVPIMNIDNEKWRDLEEKLFENFKDYSRENQSNRNKNASDNSDYNCEVPYKFNRVYLIDDFTASGTTFIRYTDSRWKGKLVKFLNIIKEAKKDEETRNNFPISSEYKLYVHHYISTKQAESKISEKIKELMKCKSEWEICGPVEINEPSQSHLLSENAKLCSSRDSDFVELCNKYYDHSLYERLERHCRESGQSDMKMGYANCALSLILEHNTPNNSIPLLWAETEGDKGHEMSPLFRRSDRHG